MKKLRSAIVKTGLWDFSNVFRFANIIRPTNSAATLPNIMLQLVTVVGFVQQAITLGLEKNMLIEDAILKAGGFQDNADKNLVVINRENIKQRLFLFRKLQKLEALRQNLAA